METTICGIPCLVEITYFFRQKPLGPRADNDHDCYGYTNIDFDVLDRRGRPAPWLEKKLTDDERQRIETEIEEAHDDSD